MQYIFFYVVNNVCSTFRTSTSYVHLIAFPSDFRPLYSSYGASYVHLAAFPSDFRLPHSLRGARVLSISRLHIRHIGVVVGKKL